MMKGTHSDDSILSLEGMIIMRQFKRMVKMMVREKSGCTRMWMATLRTGLKGDKAQMALSAENLKISRPLLMTMNVWKEKRSRRQYYQHFWRKSRFFP